MRFLDKFCMKYDEFKENIQCDLYRYESKVDEETFFRYMKGCPGFQFTFFLRLCQYCSKSEKFFVRRFIFRYALNRFYKYSFRWGIDIPWKTEIGKGFYIGHYGGIIVNGKSKIGKNCNISHQVTLGKGNRGPNKGYPIIGDNVYIGPGAKIVGNVKIGNNVAIGANCVVTKDIPDNAVVVGIPGKVISWNGAKDYVNHTDYD